MKKMMRARAVRFGRVLPTLLVAGSSLAGCDGPVRPLDPGNHDAGAVAQSEPSTAESGEGGTQTPGETPPSIGALGPNSTMAGQSGTAIGPGESSDAGVTGPVCVPSGPRDCSSEFDNDCDGRPDNVIDDVCRCVPGAVEACDEHPGADGLGLCKAGARTCVVGADAGSGSSDWSACEGAVGPGASDSCDVAGDDTDCDGIPNEGCACVDGETQQCGSTTDVGVCAFGTSTCVNAAFGACEGAVAPAARDACTPGDDANCNGVPNEGCGCIDGETRACGSDVGNCTVGTQTCSNGSFSGQCVGSVGPAGRDSCSTRGDDANCNGVPNEGCGCVDGETRSCGSDVGNCSVGTQTCVNGTFSNQCVGSVGPSARNCNSSADNDCDGRPDNTIDNVCQCAIGTSQVCGTHPQDGVGSCRAGSQQCQAGPGNSSSSFGQCQGSVGPAPQDSCTIPGDDSNCNGTLNDNCIQPLGLGEPCENAQQCESGSCEAFYVDEDRDGYSPSLAGMQRLCSNANFLPARTTRRQPTNNRTTDCADDTNVVNPEQDQFFAAPITGRSATDPLAYDYNCDGVEESIFQDDTERSISPGGAPTCTFAPFDLCNGGRIQRDPAPCGQTAFIETCGPMDPQPDFPGLGCFSTDIAESSIFCR